MVILSWVSGLSGDWSEIISAVIQALGTITAALIAALWANRIVNGIKLRSYSDAPDNIRSVLKKARSDIFIITAVGDNLLKTVERDLAQRLRSGIHVRFLLLDLNRFHEIEKYLHGKNPKDEEIFYTVLKTLCRLQQQFPESLEIRIFPGYMTASYIGIDTCPDASRDRALLSPFIQVLLYQYHISVKNSAILYFYEKTDQRYYDSTVESMRDMWEDAEARLKKRQN